MSRRWLAGGIGFLASIMVVAIAQAGTAVLAWDYIQGPTLATQFAIYRHTGTEAAVRIGMTPVAQQTYRDATVVTGQTYIWTVTAIAATGEESAHSNAVTFRVPLSPPASPAGLRGTIEP